MIKKLSKSLFQLRLNLAIRKVENSATRYLNSQTMRNWDRMLKAAHELAELRKQGTKINNN